MEALYAFSRHTDDLGDSDAPTELKRRELEDWRTRTEQAINGQPNHFLLAAVADTVRRFQIDKQNLFDLIDGVEMDLAINRYATWRDLEAYCHKVAAVVGLACLRIWGVRDVQADGPAAQCGYALQLTNILRDLKEDAARGRIYLPLEDLRRFDYAPEELTAGVCDCRFRELLQFEIDRAKSLYEGAAPLWRFLSPAPRRVFAIMTGAYLELLSEIERRPADLFSRRIRLSWRQKMATIIRQGLAR